jgi:hypothetical protein
MPSTTADATAGRATSRDCIAPGRSCGAAVEPPFSVEISMRETLIRERVRRLLRDAELPADDPVRVWAGPSRGRVCCCCDEGIRTVTEYEVDFSADRRLYFHPRCYAIWKDARREPHAGGSAEVSGLGS